MAVRIRADGRVVCAAMHPAEPSDAYIDDGLHYLLSVEKKMLVTEPMHLPSGKGLGGHEAHGQWWWKGQQPAEAMIDLFYLT